MKSENKKTITGIGLVSGGLDSLIATLLLKIQNIKVIILNFKSPFCVSKKECNRENCSLDIYKEKFNIEIIHKQIQDDYIEMLKNPKFGYGKNFNPCIDCRIYILKKTKEFAEEIGADFIFTGEVLNQRPKSQTKQALEIVEKESNLEGILLRPLSAKLLKPTILEEKGIIDRSQLLGIEGRSRKTQVELARKYNLLTEYFASGGCLLTDKSYSLKAKDLINHCENLKLKDFNMLKYGRHFRYKKAKIIIGRNEQENTILEQSIKPMDILMYAKYVKGPITIIQGDFNDDIVEFAAKVTLRYSDLNEKNGIVIYKINNSNVENELSVNRASEDYYKNYMI
ncbi:MAG: hypothetical protein JXA99_10015 [Candidatus Lokiarchaeota archaeon]|nr:hypothetical protein [Candidatus Lokiarchaeota archaeon]